MASFGHDPYDYYYTTAAPYTYPYYQRQPAAPTTRSRRSSRGDMFAGAEPELAMSADEAAVRMQAAARGFLARKSVRAVREVARAAERIGAKMAESEVVAFLAEDPSARAAVAEALMKMLLRLDAVRGARVYRRRVTKRVLALQDAVDALGTKPAPVEADASETTAAGMAEESGVAPEMPDAAERGSEMGIIKNKMEVDKATAAGEPEGEAGEEKEAEVPSDANVDVDEDEPESDAEGEWEMVPKALSFPATSDVMMAPPLCLLELLETARTPSASAASDDGVDARKRGDRRAGRACGNTGAYRAADGGQVKSSMVSTFQRLMTRWI